jgi:hypothetical protein
MKNSQKHLYIIAMQFVDLLRDFVKQAQCWTQNEVGDHLNLTIRSLWTLRKLAQEKDIGLATAHKGVREKLNLFPYKIKNETGSGLYRRSWSSLLTPFINAQRFSESILQQNRR